MISTTKKPILFSELNDDNKGEFIELKPEELQNIINGVSSKEDVELGSAFDFHKVYDAEYYAINFPGFEDFVYQILEQETIELNKELPNEGHWYFPLTESNDIVPLSKDNASN